MITHCFIQKYCFDFLVLHCYLYVNLAQNIIWIIKCSQTTRYIPKGFKKKGRGVSVLLFDTGKEIFGVWIRQKSFSSAAIDTEISTCGQILIIINIVFNWITCKNKNKNNLNFLNFGAPFTHFTQSTLTRTIIGQIKSLLWRFHEQNF